MKLNKETLKRIIKEELQAVLSEDQYEQDSMVAQGKFTKGGTAEKQRASTFTRRQNTAQNQLDNTAKIAADLDKDGRFIAPKGAEQAGVNDKYDRQDDIDAVQNKAREMEGNVFPFIENDIDRFAKEKGISTEDLRKKLSSFLMSTKAAREMEPYLVDMLGKKTFDSLMAGKRTVFSKLANKMKGGKFAENKRRR